MSSLFLSQADQILLCKRFNQVMAYAKNNFSFYEKFYLSHDAVSKLQDLSSFPIIHKNTPNINLLIEEALSKKPPAYFETSGTTGNPFPVLPDLSETRTAEFAHYINEWLSLNIDPISRAIIALPFEMNPIGLKYLTALTHLGIMAIPAGVKTHLCPPQKILDLIQRLKPELLVARPLETLRYAEAMIAQGINPSKTSIKKIILTGEIISKSKFRRISKLFGGASVHAVYGLTELDSGGLVSCSHFEYHLPTNPYIIIELLKKDLFSPVLQENEIGQIVFTNTNENYMPLLRYQTGDFGQLKNKNCGCEYNTPIVEILGRESDLIQCNKTKHFVFPIQIENILFTFDEFVSDYQIISNQNHLKIRVELAENLNKKSVDELIKKLKDSILEQLKIMIDEVEVFLPNQLANKLGIAKAKAGTLYVLDDLDKNQTEEKLQLNYCC